MCDNTDCQNKEINPELHHIILTRDFNFDECEWCIECIIRDKDMIEYCNDIPLEYIIENFNSIKS